MSFSLYLGPYQPFLEERLLAAYQNFRTRDPFTKITVLVPNYLLVGHLRRMLTEKGQDLFNLEVHTLRHYMEDLAEETAIQEDLKTLPDVLAPLVLKEVTASPLKKSKVFGAVSQTPGFYHALRATLSELKEGLYTPVSLKTHAARLDKAQETRLADKLKEFATFLGAYEDWKKKNRWLDREDTYFKVLESPLAADRGCHFIYGFYDASAVQKKMLAHFSDDQSAWFIPYEDSSAFDYAKPFVDWAKTLGHVQGQETWKAPADSPRQRLQKYLFQAGDPGVLSSEELVGTDCRVLLCPGEPRESKEVARALLNEADRQDVFLSDCAVVLRETGTYRNLMPPAFEAQGVPLSKTLPAPLLGCTEAKVFLLLLDNILEDFPRDKVMDFLASPTLLPEKFGLEDNEWNPSAWDVLSREARVVEGEREWTARILSWRKQKEKGNREEDENLPPTEAVQASLAFEKVLGQLFQAKTQFDQSKKWGEKAATLKAFLEKVSRPSDNLTEVCGVVDSFVLLSGSFTLHLTAEDLRSLIASMLEQKNAASKQLIAGGVQVVDLMQARGVSFDVVALPGLVEKFVPRLVRQDPLLLDEERLLLTGREGAEIALKQAGALEERLLFLLATRSAKKALLLTAPHLNPVTGSPRTPSIYLFESVEAILGRRVSRLGDAVGLVTSVTVSDWVKKDLAACGDSLETLLTAVAQAHQGDHVAALAVADDKPFFFEGAEALKDRQAYSLFTAHDGLVTGAEAQQALAKNHSLDLSAISASRLETFATCPLRYFYKYVLHLNVTPDPEKVLELQASDRGNLMHDILEKTLERGVAEGWAAQHDSTAGLAVLEEEKTKAFTRFEKEGVTGATALWAWEKEQMTRDLHRVLTDLLADEAWTPLAFEVAFGKADSEVVFPLSNGLKLKLQGRMDRVDISANGHELRVVDYKTGGSSGVSKNSIKAGTKLQLPFYLWALRHLYPAKQSRQALYDYITRRGDYKQIPFDIEKAGAVEPVLDQVLTTVAEGVTKGLFPSVGQACDHCDYRKLCGTGMEDRAKRKQEDPQAAAYYALEQLK